MNFFLIRCNILSNRLLLCNFPLIQNSFYHSSSKLYNNRSPDHLNNDNLNFEENKHEKKLHNRFSVDTSGLIGYGSEQPWSKKKMTKILSKSLLNNKQNVNTVHHGCNLDDDDDDDSDNEYPQEKHKEPLSPLAKDLISYIKIRGPITLHDYMSQALNHSIHGYYQHKNEKIGTKGDFITSPEISQLFGEMIAIWMLSTWQSLGSPSAINIVEFGPGKGTLMKDILRVTNKFPKFKNSIHIHMIELSETMRKMQRESTNCFESSKHGLNSLTNNDGINNNESINLISSDGIKISWHSFLDQVPRDSKPILFIGQEFLDAFPIHQFAYTNKGWREKLIDIDDSEESKFHFRVVLSPSATPAIQALLGEGRERHFSQSSNQYKNNHPLIPQLDPITGKLLNNQTNDMNNTIKSHPDLVEGDGIEICPLALATSEDIAKRVCQSGGAGLFIDYGENFTQSDSLRAFKKHNQVNFLSEPGLVDMTADVDFSAIGRAAESRGAKVMTAIGQGEFLMRMGIVERVEKLIDIPATTDEEATILVSSMKKLVMDGKGNMGTRFKVMSISHPNTHVAGFN